MIHIQKKVIAYNINNRGEHNFPQEGVWLQRTSLHSGFPLLVAKRWLWIWWNLQTHHYIFIKKKKIKNFLSLVCDLDPDSCQESNCPSFIEASQVLSHWPNPPSEPSSLLFLYTSIILSKTEQFPVFQMCTLFSRLDTILSTWDVHLPLTPSLLREITSRSSSNIPLSRTLPNQCAFFFSNPLSPWYFLMDFLP